MIELLRKIGYLRYRVIPRPWYYGRRYREIASFLKESASWGEERMRSYQLGRMQEMVAHAYHNSRFYRRLYDGVGFIPSDLRDWADFEKLPLVTREDIATYCEDFKASDFNHHQPIATHTSGTTGSPLALFRSREQELFRAANSWRWRRTLGFNYYQKWIDITGRFNINGGSGVTRWNPTENCFLLNRSLSDRAHIEEVFAFIRRARPRMIFGWPSAYTAAGLHAIDLGLEPLNIPLVLTVGETIQPHYRKVIERMFSKNIYDFYGNRENTVSAFQFSVNGPYSISAESCVVETITHDGSPCGMGIPGEIVTTSLVNLAFPLIRYRLGDLVTLHGYQRVGEINLPTLTVQGGRNKDLILTRQGLLPIYTFYSLDYSGLSSVRFSRYVQKSLDEIEIEALVGPEFVRERDEPIMLRFVKSYFPFEIKFTVRYIDTIPICASGKVKCVESPLAEAYLGGRLEVTTSGKIALKRESTPQQ